MRLLPALAATLIGAMLVSTFPVSAQTVRPGPNEMASLFTLLAQGKAVSPSADSAMLGILARNVDDAKLLRYADGVRAAHKTGDVDNARTDCGVLLYLPARVVACVLTKENVDTRYWIDAEGNTVIGRIGAAIVAHWAPRQDTAR